jgi:23S rRNA (uracil1939-C5)-methyltransferase
MKIIELENVEIVDFAAEGKAIAKDNGMVIFVDDAIPGDIVNLRIRRKKNYAEGTVTQIVKPSELSVQPFCRHFGDCGGCVSQRMPYSEQLKYKAKQVVDQFQRIGGVEMPVVKPILPSGKTIFYRNKLEFTFSNKRWLTKEEIGNEGALELNALGFHVSGRFDKVLDLERCMLQASPSNEIRNEAKRYALSHGYEFFDVKNKTGFLRNLIVRTSSTGETMLVVVFAYYDKNKIHDFLDNLNEKFAPTSLQYAINPKMNDNIGDLEVLCHAGKPFIEEKMENLTFRIGAKSFYQTNSEQAYVLYDCVRKYADFKGNETVYDLYTGTGTIACFVAANVGKVVGIEYVSEAIDDARANAALNGIENAVFYAGDIKDVMTNEFIATNGSPDVIILDPPRAGLHPSIPQKLMEIAPDKIIYVSCNPATQARDIALLSEKYYLVEMQPVDMFPHTAHVENIALLRKFHTF